MNILYSVFFILVGLLLLYLGSTTKKDMGGVKFRLLIGSSFFVVVGAIMLIKNILDITNGQSI